MVNAASGAPQLSAGALATVFGTNLASSALTGNRRSQTTLGGVSVNVNGQPAPIQFVNGTQVNFQVPWETTGATAEITLTLGERPADRSQCRWPTAGPGFLPVRAECRSQHNSPSNPAAVGSTIQAYLTGTGPVTPSIDAGAAAPTNGDQVTAGFADQCRTIGSSWHRCRSRDWRRAWWGSGSSHIVVPSDLTTGDYPLVLGIGDETSNSGTVSVTL